MAIEIHPTAVVDSAAKIGEGVSIGPYSVIEADVVIGDGCEIMAHALISDGARLGKEVKIFKGAAVSGVPQDLKFGGEKTTLEIGDKTVIREFTTLNRGTSESGKSVIGSNCLIMAYVHVAHDCYIGDNVILANAVNLAGHITIEDNVIIGGLVPIHQFVTIGEHAFIGGGFRCPRDVPPYALTAGEPMVFRTLNLIGLKRRGFTRETINAISKTYKTIYAKDTTIEEGIAKAKENALDFPEVKKVIDFFEASERGVIGSG